MRSGLRSKQSAFSLLETLVAMAITVGIAAAAFQLFYRNERLFRDQALILEMQQSARLIIAQIADDVRMAGQGVPPGLSEVFLPGSDASRLNMRASFSAAESVVTSSLPLPVAIAATARLKQPPAPQNCLLAIRLAMGMTMLTTNPLAPPDMAR